MSNDESDYAKMFLDKEECALLLFALEIALGAELAESGLSWSDQDHLYEIHQRIQAALKVLQKAQ